MATFALIHGGGDVGWYWHLAAAELRERGHDVVAPDLPCEDDSAGLSEYADTVLDALGGRASDLVVVGHSYGAFTAPLVCDRAPARLLVLIAAMIPTPGEPPRDWWANTRYAEDAGEWDDDPIATFYHDVPPDLAAEALKRERGQSGTPDVEPWPLEEWPDVDTRVLLCRDDRVFPAAFMRRLARERLALVADEIDGSHCVALSRPQELAERLDAYLA
jgi:pimeloyl-ACP methyl ester carboxylesterase